MRLLVALVGMMCTMATPYPGAASQPQEEIDLDTGYANWCHYLFHYPDYQQHQEPTDIAVNGCQWGTWVTFPNKILAIEAKVGPWKHLEALFRSLDFIAMYKHPGHYRKHCIAYLADPTPTEQQKQIAIYAMEGLWVEEYIDFAQACYQLYQQQKLSAALFQLVLGFELARVHPLVTPPPYHTKKVHTFLQQIQAALGPATPMGLQIAEILSGRLAKAWARKTPSRYAYYGEALPFRKIVCEAAKEIKEYVEARGEASVVNAQLYTPPYFLMILEHPTDYFRPGIDQWDKEDAEGCLADPHLTDMEKRLVITSMQQSACYDILLGRVCTIYDAGRISLQLVADMLCSRFPNLYKYPPFILDYKEHNVRFALDKLIALPTIPCGLKEMAQKIQAGQLATPQEMQYLAGYREFRKTHFTLYETIPPRNR